jgi:hypothetical protein
MSEKHGREKFDWNIELVANPISVFQVELNVNEE